MLDVDVRSNRFWVFEPVCRDIYRLFFIQSRGPHRLLTPINETIMNTSPRTVVGSVEFTAQGVVISKPYNSYEDLNIRPTFDGIKFMSYLKARIEHCAKSLNENIMRATFISQELVLWEGGRFSRPVYDKMLEFYTAWQNVEDVTIDMLLADSNFKLVIQQVVRYMYDNHIDDKELFYILTELLLCA